MKADSLSRPMNTPFTAPIIMPATMAATKPKGALPVAVRVITPTPPEKATLDPTLRSIPPVSMMKVMPIDTRNSTAMDRSRMPILASE